MFSKDEFELIFKIMKEGKSVEEQQKMDETLAKRAGSGFPESVRLFGNSAGFSILWYEY